MFPKIAGLIEVLLLSVVYYLIWDQYRVVANDGLFLFRGKLILMMVYAVISFMVFTACDSFNFGNLKLSDIALSQCISVLIVNFITYLQICLILTDMTTPIPMLELTGIDFIVCVVWSWIAKKTSRKYCRVDDALLIFGSAQALALKEKMDSRQELYNVTEVVSADEPEEAVCGAIDRHEALILNDVPAEMRNDILKYAFGKNKMIFMVPKITDIIMKGTTEISSFDTPLVKVRNEGLLPLEGFVKRCFDIALSSVLLLLLSPAFLIIPLLIKAEDAGPVFYRQKRLTLNDRTFEILKFRSMVADAEKLTGAVLAEKDDPRITKVGRALRACRLDELPQLINIFLGDMSFVGPRPERPELAEDIIKDTPEFAFRTKVKGGLTGYAQVYGKYSTTNYDKLRLDLIYIENYSLLLDLKLLFMTPQILFRREASEGVDKVCHRDGSV
ncbi:MAG: exopolysaccharide biosynthesis polyprenyl glycosylphosphotransferase [Eubacteriales bacterium]|nr:exopolysaccharide biosynthesis polyprenyl glycosylphosphotransferase [Eubacteriales bacterium]